MAGQTPRFALNFFGGDNPGSIDDDDGKYTGEDRLSIDRILSALEKHNHHLSASMDAPDDMPTAVLDLTVEGALDGGTTYYYCVSFVNADGLETVSGPEVSVATPDLLEEPDAPSGETAASTGTLSTGLYYYALSSLRGDEESGLSDIDAVTVLDGENTVILTLPVLGDATSFQIWRQKDTDPGWTRVGISSTPTFTDTGAVPAGTYGNPANVPPTSSTDTSQYTVRITLTGDDLTRVQTATAWRLYRTESSGLYTAASLVHEVIEHVDDTDPDSALMSTWLDDGDATLTGSPKVFSTELVVPPFTIDTQDPLPAATAYPDGYPMLDGSGVLYIARAGVWGASSGSRGVALYTGIGNPTGTEPTGSQAGDVYIDKNNGDVYVLDGP